MPECGTDKSGKWLTDFSMRSHNAFAMLRSKLSIEHSDVYRDLKNCTHLKSEVIGGGEQFSSYMQHISILCKEIFISIFGSLNFQKMRDSGFY